ncbi:MAG: hypothetical protein WCI17_03060 [bacterium]
MAGRYAEYAMGAPMAQRREKWRLHNNRQEKTIPFHIEDNGSYFRDLTRQPECENAACRTLESQLLLALTAYEKIDDDRIIPARFVVDWCTPSTGVCDELCVIRADNGRGDTKGYTTNHPIRDIDADFGKLKKSAIRLDREESERRLHLAEEVFAGLLPVEAGRSGSAYSSGITNRAVHLMGMQELYLQMAIKPEAVHRLFGFIAEDNLAIGQWEEEQGLLTSNHDGNQGYCTGSSLFSDETVVLAGRTVRSADRYGYLESQESAGISPAMFDEFVMPYLAPLAAKFKFLMYGCCEAVHHLMPSLLRLHGLRKVSVTPWCDLRFLANTCPTDIIWCRKPVPLLLCGDTFSEAALRSHLQETLDVGKDWFIEFVYRDTDRLTGAMADRVSKACAMIRSLTRHPEGSRG